MMTLSLPDTVDVESQLALPNAVYLDRKPPLSDFVTWAEADAPATRLQSLVGPPGIGKTTHLRQLAAALREESVMVTVMELDLARVRPDEGSLRAWVGDQLEKLVKQGAIVLSDPSVIEGQSFLELWYPLIATLGAGPAGLVLLLDGFDELDANGRKFVEQHVLMPFLFPAVDNCQNRAVVARRDEYALNEGLLRWEDEVISLDPLDAANNQPAKQIEQRLKEVGKTPDEARRLLEWLDAPEAAIATAIGLDDAGRKALAAELTPALTSNPFVNLLLLQRRLQGGAALTADDYRACLQAYLERARLARPAEGLSADELARRVNALPDPDSFTSREFDSSSPIMAALLEDGIVVQISGTARYRLDPAVIHLVQHIQPRS